MEDTVGSIENFAQAIGLVDIAVFEHDAIDDVLEVFATPAGEVIDNHHLGSARKERVNQVTPDEPRAAGYNCATNFSHRVEAMRSRKARAIV
jgi:hypothetical protein